jgi:hypothetical protein
MNAVAAMAISALLAQAQGTFTWSWNYSSASWFLRLQKIIPLLLADGHFEFLHRLQKVFPDFALRRQRLVS